MNNFLSRKNMNLIINLLALFFALWVLMYAVPGLFPNLFYTGLGNFVLLIVIVLAFMYHINLGVGLLFVFIVLFRFARMTAYEGLAGPGPIFVGGSVPPILIPVT
jgi:hypothetical protein